MDAFDADVLIYAAAAGHPLGTRVRALLDGAEPGQNIGSVLLIPEILIKPKRLGRSDELADLERLIAALDLHEVHAPTVDLALELGCQHGLRTVDAVHLATAVIAGADRFITNNRRDFEKEIAEIDVVFPESL